MQNVIFNTGVVDTSQLVETVKAYRERKEVAKTVADFQAVYESMQQLSQQYEEHLLPLIEYSIMIFAIALRTGDFLLPPFDALDEEADIRLCTALGMGWILARRSGDNQININREIEKFKKDETSYQAALQGAEFPHYEDLSHLPT